MTFQVIALPALKLSFQLPILIHDYPQAQHHNKINANEIELKVIPSHAETNSLKNLEIKTKNF